MKCLAVPSSFKCCYIKLMNKNIDDHLMHAKQKKKPSLIYFKMRNVNYKLNAKYPLEYWKRNLKQEDKSIINT